MNENTRIQELLRERADCHARLNLLPYDGTPEVKEINGRKYLYIRKRMASKISSTYVGAYSEELHQLLLRNAREARELRKAIRRVERELARLNYTEHELPPRVMLNLDFARANMKSSIYDQAVLEGVATTFPQTEDIIENGIVNGVRASDVQKILNLKHAWEFILDKDIIRSGMHYYVLCHIARLVNEGFYSDGGRLRGVPVAIGGTSYIPPMLIESKVRDELDTLLSAGDRAAVDTAIELCLYCMKKQLFNDGNKRTAVIFASYYLIANGAGLLVIPEALVPEFKKLLIAYYEDKDNGALAIFMREKCWKRIDV